MNSARLPSMNFSNVISKHMKTQLVFWIMKSRATMKVFLGRLALPSAAWMLCPARIRRSAPGRTVNARLAGTLAPPLLACALLLANQSATFAATSTPPDSMTYQGFLVDANGAPLAQSNPQNYPVAFRIYSTSSGAVGLLWSEQQIVTVDKGSFSVMLGDGTAIGGEPRPALSSIFTGASASDRYISAWVTISGNTTEILPRLRLVPSPYSFLATSAANLVQPNGSAFMNFSGGQINLLGGNVGIGTTSAGRRLQIGDVNTPNSEGMIRLASRSGTGGAQRTWDIGVPETDDNVVGTRYSFVIDDTLSPGVDFMIQLGTGNVGIGTTNPAAKLDVNGSIALTNQATIQARNNGGVLENVFWPRWSDNVTYLNYGAAGFNIRNNSSASTMFVQDNGNVGIGTTTPSVQLSLGSGLANTKLALWDGGSGSAYGFGVQQNQFRLHVNTSSDDFLFLNGQAGAELMRIRGNGNIGVATPNPAKTLQVGGPPGTEGMIRLWSTASASGASRGWDIGVAKDEASTAGKAYSFSIQDTGVADPALLIRWDSQYVGIGTTNPAAKLDVRGDIKLGPTGQFSAAAGDENLRIIRGKVRIAAGPVPTITSGSGYTVTRVLNYNNGAAGVITIAYRISFTTPFADAPAVTLAVTHDSLSTAVGQHWTSKVEFTSSTEAVVSFYNPGGNTLVDSPFSFIAVGAR